MIITTILHLVAILAFLFALVDCSLPEYFHVCHRNDPDLRECIKNSVEQLRPRLKTGIPELGIPSIDPFTLDFLGFSTSTEATYLTTNITNIRIHGASDFKILKINPTLKKNGIHFQFEAILPHLRLEGDYEIDSRILLIQLQGNGPFIANTTDYHFGCGLRGHKIKKAEKYHLSFEKMRCNAIVGKISIQLDNLFRGNRLLGEAANHAINDNADAFFEEIRPGFLKAIDDKFTDIANKITLNFSYEELFP